MSMDGQRTKCRRKIAENYNRLSRMHERYRQTTDRRQTDRQTIDGLATAYSEPRSLKWGKRTPKVKHPYLLTTLSEFNQIKKVNCSCNFPQIQKFS